MSIIGSSIQPMVRGVISSALVAPSVDLTPAQVLASMFSSGVQGAWADVSDLGTMFQDNADTVPAVVGQVVRRIRDKSGRGNHLTATVPAILRQDAGGRYYLEGNGTSIAFVSAAFASPGAPNHILCVGMASLGTNINYAVIAERAIASTVVGLVLQRNFSSAAETFRVDTTAQASQSVSGGSAFNLARHVLTATAGGGQSVLRDNKTQVGTMAIAGSTDYGAIAMPLSFFSGNAARDTNQFTNMGFYGGVYIASPDVKSVDVVEAYMNQMTAAF